MARGDLLERMEAVLAELQQMIDELREEAERIDREKDDAAG